MKKKCPFIYISGKYRDEIPFKVENNIRIAEAYAYEIIKIGGFPIIPHSMYRYFDKTESDEYWLSNTVELLNRTADAAFMLNSWIRSEGSKIEKEFAASMSIPIFFNLIELKKFIINFNDKIDDNENKD